MQRQELRMPVFGENMVKRSLFVATSALLLGSCFGPAINRVSDAPLTVVSNVEIDRYLGRWYEIARLPNQFEKNCEGVTADYTLRDDGLIKVVNTCRKGGPGGEVKSAEGRARIADKLTNAKLEVSFFGPFWGDYWILWLAPDYSLSLVGEPSGRYLWILSRTPTLEKGVLQDAISRLESQGYDTDKLYFTEQPPVPDFPTP
ncbi:MAG: lipocalin family protein [Amphiplicatus sp.]|nr:lipocalin family protein [Amphiplicatus sp.]